MGERQRLKALLEPGLLNMVGHRYLAIAAGLHLATEEQNLRPNQQAGILTV